MAKSIPLTQGKFTLVDDEDFEKLNQYKWCLSHGYAVRVKGRVNIYMHREVMKTPNGMDTDHINRNRLDNRRSNLRICTRSENRQNSIPSRKEKTVYKGVGWHKREKKWQAFIKHNGKSFHLGYFTNPEDAARAYDEAAIKKFGDFARLNFS